MHTLSLPPSDRDESTALGSGAILRTLTEPSISRDGKPTERHITIYKCNELIRLKLLALRKTGQRQYSNAGIAGKIGVSSSQVSFYLNERGCIYDGDILNLEVKLQDYLRAEERRRLCWVQTTESDPAKQMLAAFNYVRETNDVGSFVAESGDGKSRGIELIQKSHPLVMVFRVRAWSNDKNSLLSSIWEVIPKIGYTANMKRAPFIVTSLQGTDRPLLVDDAHKLTRPALHLLFDLYDETLIPIFLVGTSELTGKLNDDPQRASRTGLRCVLNADEASRSSLVEHMVRAVVTNANGEFKDSFGLCQIIANQDKGGHFRAVEKTLRLAGELRQKAAEAHKQGRKYETGDNKGKPIKEILWPDAIRAAHTQLGREYQLT